MGVKNDKSITEIGYPIYLNNFSHNTAFRLKKYCRHPSIVGPQTGLIFIAFKDALGDIFR